jgi:hypothetical protein
MTPKYPLIHEMKRNSKDSGIIGYQAFFFKAKRKTPCPNRIPPLSSANRPSQARDRCASR